MINYETKFVKNLMENYLGNDLVIYKIPMVLVLAIIFYGIMKIFPEFKIKNILLYLLIGDYAIISYYVHLLKTPTESQLLRITMARILLCSQIGHYLILWIYLRLGIIKLNLT